MTGDFVLADALRLDLEARAEVAAELLASLDGPADVDAAAAWAVEIERRVAAIEGGTVKLGSQSHGLNRTGARILEEPHLIIDGHYLPPDSEQQDRLHRGFLAFYRLRREPSAALPRAAPLAGGMSWPSAVTRLVRAPQSQPQGRPSPSTTTARVRAEVKTED